MINAKDGANEDHSHGPPNAPGGTAALVARASVSGCAFCAASLSRSLLSRLAFVQKWGNVLKSTTTTNPQLLVPSTQSMSPLA